MPQFNPTTYDRFGGSLGCFCEALAAGFGTRSHSELESLAYFRHLISGAKEETFWTTDFIKTYLTQHAEEAPYCVPLISLLNHLKPIRVDEDTPQQQGFLSSTLNGVTKLIRTFMEKPKTPELPMTQSNVPELSTTQLETALSGYQHLTKHPILKWRFLLDPFQHVFGFIKEARNSRPSVFGGYYDALQKDKEFSLNMSLRATQRENLISCGYLSFAAHRLPKRHFSDIIDCLFNRGKDFTWMVWCNARLDCLVQLLGIAVQWLPREYPKSIVSAWRIEEGNIRLQQMLNDVAQTDPKLHFKLYHQATVKVLLGKREFQCIYHPRVP